MDSRVATTSSKTIAAVHRRRRSSSGPAGAAQCVQRAAPIKVGSRHGVGDPLVTKAKRQRRALFGRHGREPVALFLFERFRYSAPHSVEYKRTTAMQFGPSRSTR